MDSINRFLSRRSFVKAGAAVATAAVIAGVCGVSARSLAGEAASEAAEEPAGFDMDAILQSNEDGSWTLVDQADYETTIPSLPVERVARHLPAKRVAVARVSWSGDEDSRQLLRSWAHPGKNTRTRSGSVP